MNDKSDVLLVTRNLPPLVGGMERLIWHIVDELSTEYKVHVVGPQGSKPRLPGGCTASQVSASPIWWFLAASLCVSLIQTVLRRPRIVFAGSGLTAPIVWFSARLIQSRCVVYLHGLDIETTNRAYRFLWHPFLKRFDKIIANSAFTTSLAKAAGIPKEKIITLHPGVSLPDHSQSETNSAQFRTRHNLGPAPVMLYIGRITKRKGLDAFIDESFPKIIQQVPSAILIVIGDEPQLALNKNASIRSNIDSSLVASGMSASVRFLGALAHDDPDITAAYYAADVHVFPVQDRPGDNEGFGMVAVEAAAHGLPTVAYDAGGVSNAVSDGQSGYLVSAGDAEAFADTVVRELKSRSLSPHSIRAFSEKFAWKGFGIRLREILNTFGKSY